MMNELFILGELMEGTQCGYDLHNTLQATLGRHRRISYGVIYPLLEKLEQNNYLEIKTVEGFGEKQKKIAMITEKGKRRFFELMETPVPNGARNHDIYLIKLDVMQHLDMDQQIQLLEQFYQEQEDTIRNAEKAIRELAEENSKDHWYASKKFELRLQQAKITIDWINKFKRDLKLGTDLEYV